MKSIPVIWSLQAAQHPILDGEAITRRIRGYETGKGRGADIAALTASEMGRSKLA